MVFTDRRNVLARLKRLDCCREHQLGDTEGAFLFDLEGPCTGFVLLLEGDVDVSRPSPTGRELLLYRLQPGDTCVLTLNCLLGQGSYPARAVGRRPGTGRRTWI